jgi:hypothetical protein
VSFTREGVFKGTSQTKRRFFFLLLDTTGCRFHELEEVNVHCII